MDLSTCTQTTDDFFNNESQQVSVGVVQSGEDQRHCVLIYKFDNQFKALHLAWHYNLRYETDQSVFQDYSCIVSQLDEYRQKAVSQMCELIKYYTDIPYGIYYRKTGFSKDGKLILGKDEVGLTCATFVLAVFKSAQIELMDITTWLPREDDVEFHKKVLSGLRNSGATEEHCDKVRDDFGCARYRPEEVAVSSGFSAEEMPVNYEALDKISMQLKDKLELEFRKKVTNPS